jgi:hypothetical protein
LPRTFLPPSYQLDALSPPTFTTMATLPPDLVLPIGTSLVPGGIELTFGMVFIAIILSAVLFGILIVQMYLYYNNCASIIILNLIPLQSC